MLTTSPRARSLSVSPVRKAARFGGDPAPNPRLQLSGPMGTECLERTTQALVALAAATTSMPSTWGVQTAITDAVLHDMMVARKKSYDAGHAHGSWIGDKDLRGYKAAAVETQQMLTMLEMKHEELKERHTNLQLSYNFLIDQFGDEVPQRTPLDDISNLMQENLNVASAH